MPNTPGRPWWFGDSQPVGGTASIRHFGYETPSIMRASRRTNGLSSGQFGELTALLDRARQELGALDSKYLRANDAALIQKILSDRTIFTADHPVRRQVERLGSLASSLFGSPSITPAPATIGVPPARPPSRPPTASGTGPVQPGTHGRTYSSPEEAGDGYEQSLERVAAQRARSEQRIGQTFGANEFGHYTYLDNPAGNLAWRYTSEPSEANDWAGWGPPPPGWTTRSEIPRDETGAFMGTGLPWPGPGAPWGGRYGGSAPDYEALYQAEHGQAVPAPEEITEGNGQLAPGYREVDPDDGQEYEFQGGDAGDENSWRAV